MKRFPQEIDDTTVYQHRGRRRKKKTEKDIWSQVKCEDHNLCELEASMSYLHMTTRDECDMVRLRQAAGCDHRERYALGSEYDREFKVLLRLIRSTFLGKVKDHCCRSVFFFETFSRWDGTIQKCPCASLLFTVVQLTSIDTSFPANIVPLSRVFSNVQR